MEDKGLGKMVIRNGKVFCEFRGGKHFLFMGMELYRVGGRKEALEWIKEIHDVYDRYYENLFESITDEEWSR